MMDQFQALPASGPPSDGADGIAAGGIVVLTALAEEAQALRLTLPPLSAPRPLGPVPLSTGTTAAGLPLALVQCGIGKVNAAVATTLAVMALKPRLLIVAGVAGGLDPELSVGDVVVSRRLVMADYGALAERWITPYQPGVPPLPGFPRALGYDLPAALEGELRRALGTLLLPPAPGLAHHGRIVLGTVLTGDTFLDCGWTRERLQATHDAQAFEMEGAAAAQAAQILGGPPVLSVRALSDLAGNATAADPAGAAFAQFLEAAALRAARVTAGLVQDAGLVARLGAAAVPA